MIAHTKSKPIVPVSAYAKIANRILDPLMILLNGSSIDSPQQTHIWNNASIDPDFLQSEMMVHEEGRIKKVPRWFLFLPIFHIPILGGWREYIVIKPIISESAWHCGWMVDNICGFSRIQLEGPVRLLIADKKSSYFGLKPDGTQIPVSVVGYGKIGITSVFSRLPLL